MTYLAHIIRDGRGNIIREEPLIDHATEVAEMTKQFSSKFGAGSLGYACGFAHDLGKATPEFKGRLYGAPNRVDHSTASAQFFKKHWQASPITAYIAEHCCAAHHTGLLNHDIFSARLVKEIPVVSWIPDGLLELEIPKLHRSFNEFGLSFFLRMLFSCLVDSDYICTERFMNGIRTRLRGKQHLDAANSLEHLLAYIETLGSHSSAMVAQVRKQVLVDCLLAATFPQGLFSLTVPTGGGKTLSSLAFALKHAAIYNLDRVIYAVPYISITEQIADEFTKLFPKKVLEHHSALDLKKQSVREKLATENWDRPIILTTTAQLFESLFGSRTSTCRKLHNISRSVIILDEAQMLPVRVMYPCLAALNELTTHYGCSVISCTATQPAIEHRKNFIVGLKNVKEIASNTQTTFEAMRRTRVRYVGVITADSLCRRMRQNDTFLCVVNSRKIAADLFRMLSENTRHKGSIFHLSTHMCGEHRSRVIIRIRKRLALGLPCQVISTSLIQCGVDISFPIAYRQWAGLDSLGQVAGRCNRHGLAFCGNVIAFKLFGEFDNEEIHRQGEMAWVAFNETGSMDSLEAIETYFHWLYPQVRTKADYPNVDDKMVMTACEQRNFRNAARDFHIINDSTNSVLVPYGRGKKLIEQLQTTTEVTRELKRKFQRYLVPIFDAEYQAGINNGSIIILPSPTDGDEDDDDLGMNGYAVLQPEYYDSKLGFNAAPTIITI